MTSDFDGNGRTWLRSRRDLDLTGAGVEGDVTPGADMTQPMHLGGRIGPDGSVSIA